MTDDSELFREDEPLSSDVARRLEAALDDFADAALAGAPRPAPFAVVRILAERRRTEQSARRLLRRIALASALPLAAFAAAAALLPAPASTIAPLAATVTLVALVAAGGALYRLVALGRE